MLFIFKNEQRGERATLSPSLLQRTARRQRRRRRKRRRRRPGAALAPYISLGKRDGWRMRLMGCLRGGGGGGGGAGW